MRFDPLKAFPYPVLREGSDDYVSGAFQASALPQVIGTGHGMALKISGAFQLSVEPLAQLIEHGKAAFAVTVDCRDTFTRKHFEFQDSTFEIGFEPGELEGEFVISSCVVAKDQIEGFECADIHNDFGAGPFTFSPGNVMAQSEDMIHHISREHFAPVTSIFNFSADDRIPEDSFKVELSGDKVSIMLRGTFRDLVLRARSQKKFLPVVFNAIYLPTLVRVLSAFNEVESEQTYEGKLWYEVVSNQLRRRNIEPPIQDPAYVAQIMLGHSLKHLAAAFTELEKDV